jgi:hypothetical protein
MIEHVTARPFPVLAIADTGSPFDEAVIVIDGHEEETIVIECAGALDLAERLVAFVNARAEIVQALTAAMHALRSYEFGNASPDLARDIADQCETLTEQPGVAA